MLSYILRRLLLLFPTLIGVTAVVFFTMAFSPGGLGNYKQMENGAMQSRDTRRQVERLKRYYALDRPTPVQYGRWLNQVSPVGFRMSDRLEWDAKDLAAARERLGRLPLAKDPAVMEQAMRAASGMAGYFGESPGQVASEIAEALAEPASDKAFSLLARMDITYPDKVDDKGRKVGKTLKEEEQEQIAAILRQRGQEPAQARLVNFLAAEVQGQARVRFDHPAIKAPNLGESLRGRKVTDLVIEALPVTLLLNLLSLPIIYIVSIWSGVHAARKRGGLFDVGSAAVFMAFWSFPTMVAGMLAIIFLASAQYPHLHFFPASGLHDTVADAMPFLPRFAGGFQRGWLLDFAWHCVLPVVCLSYGGFAFLSRIQRGAMLEALTADFVRTARAKGVSENRVVWSHAFRNATMPLITMLSSIVPALFAGSFIVETIFAVDGLGRLGIESASSKDFQVVMGTTLVGTLIALLCAVGRDIAYAVADPRVSYE